MDMIEDADVGSGMSSMTRSAKNLPASKHMADNTKVGEGDGSDDETVKKSPLKRLSGPTKYLIFLYSNVDNALFEKRWAQLIILTIVETLS